MQEIRFDYRPINPALLWEEVQAALGVDNTTATLNTSDAGIYLYVSDDMKDAQSQFEAVLNAHDKAQMSEQEKHSNALNELAKLSADDLTALVVSAKAKG